VISMNGFSQEPSEIIEAELLATRTVLESHYYVLGTQVTEFESEWADYCGIEHAVGVANGLDAIEIALRALKIGPGDQVITTPMTAVATVLAILRSGATPVLADIDPTTGLLDPESVERCVTEQTRALILVHLYGQLRNMGTWVSLCDSLGIALIEDCAQSHGAKERGLSCGSFGAAGAFSFYPTKNLGAIGDAGALVTNNDQIAEQARMLRNYGQTNRYEHEVVGMNSRLDELQAALLRVRLHYLDSFTQRRQEIAARYLSEISNSFVTPLAAPLDPSEHVYHLFVVTTGHRVQLQEHLHNEGVETLIHYPISADQQVALTGITTDPQGLPNSHRHAETCLSLPCQPQMTDTEINAVIAAVNSFTTPGA
jgi:dTDP-4-amino-4,6-dideoxygalactose transaminase